MSSVVKEDFGGGVDAGEGAAIGVAVEVVATTSPVAGTIIHGIPCSFSLPFSSKLYPPPPPPPLGGCSVVSLSTSLSLPLSLLT